MLGKNLKKYRANKGYSQSEFASKLYVTRQCVSKWEQGVTEPDVETLIKIAELLDVSVDELVTGDGETECAPARNINKDLFVANILVAVFCALAYLVIWRFLPQTIPAHWTGGAIDRYGSRAEIFLNLITVAVLFLGDVVLYVVFKKFSGNKICLVHLVFMMCQIAFVMFIAAMYAKYITAVTSFATCLSSCLLLCVTLAMHPKIVKQNLWLGVRTDKTMKSAEVWGKTNALACYLFSAVSLAIFVVNLAVTFKYAYLCLAVYVVPAVIVVVYSNFIANKLDREKANENV